MLLDAHNAYPDQEAHTDRLRRALSAGTPVAIEQDLVWYHDPRTGVARSVVSHGPPISGREPSLDEYLFKAIRPIIEQALKENHREAWPVVTLNLDFKTNEPEHHAAVWALLGRYESWLTTARRLNGNEVAALEPGPLLVLTGEADEQERSFHDSVPVGGRLRLFGAVHSRLAQAGTPAEARVRRGEEVPEVSPGPRSNYRRWWNHPWAVVELGGQNRAGDWTAAEERRLRDLVTTAHAAGLWIRFYTLNGHDPSDTSGGWTPGYNFGSLQAAELRWEAAIRTGVDFVAVDQYRRVRSRSFSRARRAQQYPTCWKGRSRESTTSGCSNASSRWRQGPSGSISIFDMTVVTARSSIWGCAARQASGAGAAGDSGRCSSHHMRRVMATRPAPSSQGVGRSCWGWPTFARA